LSSIDYVMDAIYECFDGMDPYKRGVAINALIDDIRLYRDTVDEQEAIDEGGFNSRPMLQNYPEEPEHDPSDVEDF
jgi:hypothetical protein